MRKISFDLALAIMAMVGMAAVVLGCLVLPDVFWDGLVWKYFWGPIVSDAGGTDEVTSSYNWVDTISYGLVLALSVYYIHRLFQRIDLRVGLFFFIALSPVILLGPSTRVLEDMELFNEPLQYVFISPVIYIFLGVATLLTLLLSVRIERKWKRTCTDSRWAGILFMLIPGLIISLLLEMFPSWWNGPPPFTTFFLISICSGLLAAVLNLTRRYERLLLIFWSQVVVFVLIFYARWMTKGEFYDNYTSLMGDAPDINPLGALAIIGLMASSLALISLGLYLLSKKSDRAAMMFNGVNIMILGGHLLDASATFVGIDHYGYVEKHKLPTILIDLTGTASVMYPLKLLFILPALYILDVVMEDEKKKNVHIMALVKLTILILGFAPGARDLLRLMMGV